MIGVLPEGLAMQADATTLEKEDPQGLLFFLCCGGEGRGIQILILIILKSTVRVLQAENERLKRRLEEYERQESATTTSQRPRSITLCSSTSPAVHWREQSLFRTMADCAPVMIWYVHVGAELSLI